jgi:CRISPR-associated protein Cmr6
MDEQKGRRWFIVPGARWRVTFTARPSCYIEADARGKVLRKLPIEDPALILRQASAALWLLCHFGGVGAKARRGFGCFRDLPGMTMQDCKKAATALRRACKVNDSFREAYAQSPALEQLPQPDGSTVPWLEIEAPSPWPNYWALLNVIGDAAQQFAEGYAHQVEKKALGLPRNVRGQGVFRPGRHVEGRHAAPAWYHVAHSVSGYVIRVAVLPARELPDVNTSREFHTKLLEHLKQQLPRMLQQQHSHGQKAISNPGTPGASSQGIPAAQPARALKSGDRIEGVIVEDQKKKNRLFALHEPSRLEGPILNANEVPAELKQIGARIPLMVQSISSDGKQVQFRYSAAPEPKAPVSGSPARDLGGKPPRKGGRR